MSLFDSASLVVTPNGTKASKLYAIKPTDGSGDLVVTRATTATRVNSSGLIESVATNVPRLDYTNSSCPSILVEQQRTNLILRSQEIDNASWGKDNSGTGVLPVVTANYTTAPDGTNTADRVQFSNIGKTLTTDYSLIGQYPITLGSTGTFTIYLKSNTSSNQNVLCYWGAGEGTVFSVTPQWQRFTLPNLTAGLAGIGIGSRGGFGFTAGGDEILDISIWGAQLEAGSYATSYIPTTSASVTRNADVISKTDLSLLPTSYPFTLFADGYLRQNNDVLVGIINIASSDQYYNIGATANGFIATARNTTLSSASSSSGRLEGFSKVAAVFTSSQITLYANGNLIGTVSNTTAFNTNANDLLLSQLRVNSDNRQRCSLKTVAIFNYALSNAELATLTTI